jgi:AhpD family alkylhydroperoxidase
MSTTLPRMTYEAFTAAAPAAYAAMTAMGQAVDATGLDKGLTELMKVRASQINGCAFCLQYHLTLARRLGVASEKLDLVATWREAGVFSERDMAALAWTEALTRMQGVDDDLYREVRRHFSDGETVALTLAVAAINQWNRIGVALSFAPILSKRGDK